MMRTQTVVLAALIGTFSCVLQAMEPPGVGDKAPDFALKTLDDQTVRLSDITSRDNVVLIVLRGWPGYQCPICDLQVHDYIASSSAFAAAKARLVFIYPGPANDLKAHAGEFKSWKAKQWPSEFLYVLDPEYSLVNAYRLRWDAPKETAYPSTFVIDKQGIIRFAKISHTHGDRTKASDILAELKKLTAK